MNLCIKSVLVLPFFVLVSNFSCANPLQLKLPLTSISYDFSAQEFDKINNFILNPASLLDSPDAKLESISDEKKISTFFNNFNKYKLNHFDRLNSWALNNLKTSGINSVFYPFSGPDLLHPLNIFPNAKEYTLIGLEPITDPILNSELDKKSELRDGLEFLYSNIEEQINVNFFKTKVMNKKLTLDKFKSVTPMLVFYLKSMNYAVDRIEVTKSNGYKKLTVIFSQGESKKTLIYYSLNLDDASFRANNDYKDLFLKSYDVTMIKAASFLMWEDHFKSIKNLILSTSKNILMDSSAFPIKNLKDFDVDYFGSYTGPISLFKTKIDKDLLGIYKDRKSEPLRFKYGYTDNNLKSHIIFATKK